VAARLNAPVLGADSSTPIDKGWQTSFSWRNQKSDRHFTGRHEDKERLAEGSEVINWINQAEFTITRTFSPRTSLTLGIPYLMAIRSNPLRDPAQGNEVVDRTETQARGIGDITLIPRWWVFDPNKSHRGNLLLGMGGKLPTGENDVQDSRLVRDPNSGTFVPAVRTVDQSIMPGDGGFGIVLDLQGFYRFNSRFAGYATGTYLVNPEEKSDVLTYRNGAGEEVMSIPDQYLYRIGGAFYPGKGFGLDLGWRIEGMPTHDLIGGSDGFRRPGYAASIEPGISWTRGAHTFSVSVPYAIHRNRFKSVPDLDSPPRHGDAAFADYVILVGWFHRFGEGEKVAPATSPAQPPTSP
jgi:hypothetical protein